MPTYLWKELLKAWDYDPKKIKDCILQFYLGQESLSGVSKVENAILTQLESLLLNIDNITLTEEEEMVLDIIIFNYGLEGKLFTQELKK